MDALNWRKASYSASNGGGCVEVGGTPSAVLVRDTQDRTGPVLTFSAGAWRRFADQVKRSLARGCQVLAGRSHAENGPAGVLAPARRESRSCEPSYSSSSAGYG